MRLIPHALLLLCVAGCPQSSSEDLSATDMSPPWDTGPVAPRDATTGGDGPDAIISAPQAARARPTCGPADGPAWSFEMLVTPETFNCDVVFTRERVMLEVFDDLAPEDLPRTFDVGAALGPDAGSASHCDGDMCTAAERGTIEIVLFDPPAPGEGSSEGLLRYDIELPSGERLTSEATIPFYCEGFGGCG